MGYERLRRHVRTCPGVRRVEDRERAWNAHLGAETERLELKLDTLLSAFDRLEATDDGDPADALPDDVEPRTPE